MSNPRIAVALPALLALGWLLAMAAPSVPHPPIAAGDAPLTPTPHTGEGPFYPPDDSLEADHDLSRVEGGPAPQGELLEVVGTVRDVDGEPVRNALVVIWQVDAAGKYDHPEENRVDADGRKVPLDPGFQYWGKTRTDASGGYRFRTIYPGNYGRPNHIHFKVRHDDYRELATEMEFAGDPKLVDDSVTRGMSDEQRRSLLVEVENPAPGGEARVARFDLVLRR